MELKLTETLDNFQQLIKILTSFAKSSETVYLPLN